VLKPHNLLGVGFGARSVAVNAVSVLVVAQLFAHNGAWAAGLLASALQLPPLVMQWVSGHWYDHHSPRSLLTLATILESAAMVLAVTTQGRFQVFAALLLAGTSTVFNTTITPAVMESVRDPLRSSVLVGLSFDIASCLSAVVLFGFMKVNMLTSVLCVLLVLCGSSVLTMYSPAKISRKREPILGPWIRPAVVVLVILLLVEATIGPVRFWQSAVASTGASSLDVIVGVFAVGAVLGNLVLKFLGDSQRSVQLGIIVSSFGLALSTVSDVPGFYVVGSFLYGVGCAWWFQGLRSWIMASAPEKYRGRAGAAMLTCVSLPGLFTGVLWGDVVSSFGVTSSAVVCAVFSIISCLLLPKRIVWA
jgi:MFS family permease